MEENETAEVLKESRPMMLMRHQGEMAQMKARHLSEQRELQKRHWEEQESNQ